MAIVFSFYETQWIIINARSVWYTSVSLFYVHTYVSQRAAMAEAPTSSAFSALMFCFPRRSQKATQLSCGTPVLSCLLAQQDDRTRTWLGAQTWVRVQIDYARGEFRRNRARQTHFRSLSLRLLFRRIPPLKNRTCRIQRMRVLSRKRKQIT